MSEVIEFVYGAASREVARVWDEDFARQLRESKALYRPTLDEELDDPRHGQAEALNRG